MKRNQVKTYVGCLLTFICVILCSFSFLPALYAERQETPKRCYYIGSVGKSRIQMELKYERKKISGYYCYESDGRSIALEGVVNALIETFNQKETGRFIGQENFSWEKAKITGSWYNPSGKVKLPFVLNKIAQYTKLRSSGSNAKGQTYAISIDYPQFIGAYQWLNESMRQEIRENYTKLIPEAKEYLQEDPNCNIYNDVSYQLEYLTKNLLCLSAFTESDWGGVHPNSTSNSLVFRVTPKTVVRVKLDDCFKPGYEDKLSKRLEKRFQRNFEELTEGPGEDAMMYFEVNMPIVRRRGLEFIIPGYRRGPMNAGMLNVEVPYVEVKDLIRENGPLGELIKKGKG